MPINDGKINAGEHAPPKGDIVNHPDSGPESVKLGYETTDVNAGGVAVFLAGLFGFVLIFFAFCFLMGKTINTALEKQDGPVDKWHNQNTIFEGALANGGKREDLKSNAAIQQQQLQQMTAAFPGPRLQTDDGNQDTADLHAREDLLLDHYSTTAGEQGIRIPIDRAMLLVVQKGLPVTAAAQSGQELAGDHKPVVLVPLTSGFARTGYELDTIEARAQKMSFAKEEESSHAELKPIR
ncbi:hypothetical protein [Granulicella tundricola]|uniref:Uncharacterized protein n=1 Tax=Granulicella tundricola (strain ATCC BAA-1859 / DSM 23138 / MP5ACTX9) TaxID=1198114 RepID=E8X4A3_GRATM|nr:hypothetical protein [Granulicella tundricola]ADW67163.1 hypothetical protein AciX9_0072 [Granulicella tundricola MP5ACTX9]